jgi:5-(carboxyamino)imidazole ribonucleotide mutase
MPKVAIVMGSKSDAEYIQPCLDVLADMGIDFDSFTISAHRHPNSIRKFAQGAEDKGYEVIIGAAGYAAHLPGVIASMTTLPIIGVPLPTSDLRGVDSILSIAQMPAGIPVATVAIGKTGSINAAYLAAEILGLKYDKIKDNYKKYRLSLEGDSNDKAL